MPRVLAIHDAIHCGGIYDITTWKPPRCSVIEDRFRKCERSYGARGLILEREALGLLPKLYWAEEPPRGMLGKCMFWGWGLISSTSNSCWTRSTLPSSNGAEALGGVDVWVLLVGGKARL